MHCYPRIQNHQHLDLLLMMTTNRPAVCELESAVGAHRPASSHRPPEHSHGDAPNSARPRPGAQPRLPTRALPPGRARFEGGAELDMTYGEKWRKREETTEGPSNPINLPPVVLPCHPDPATSPKSPWMGGPLCLLDWLVEAWRKARGRRHWSDGTGTEDSTGGGFRRRVRAARHRWRRRTAGSPFSLPPLSLQIGRAHV